MTAEYALHVLAPLILALRTHLAYQSEASSKQMVHIKLGNLRT